MDRKTSSTASMAKPSSYAPLTTELSSDGSGQSWSTGQEVDKDWDNYLHGFKAQWFWLVVLYCTPPGLIFGYSIVMSAWYGSWWNTSGNEPYEPRPADIGTLYNPVFNSLPVILKSHMTFAVPMLGGILLQVALAYFGVIKSNVSAMKGHTRFGSVLLVIILACVGLGTLSLWFCDVQNKRGAETMFFVMIGFGIMASGVRGIAFASQGLHGLHMQYMTFTVCLIFTPGFNRITTVLVRHLYAYQEDYSQQCFIASTWSPIGYYWTWSFLLGLSYMALLWLCPWSPAKVPFFKVYSFGFFYALLMGAIMLACLFQALFLWWPEVMDKLYHGLDCSEQRLNAWRHFAATLRNTSLFDQSHAGGLCTASKPYDSVSLFGGRFRQP